MCLVGFHLIYAKSWWLKGSGMISLSFQYVIMILMTLSLNYSVKWLVHNLQLIVLLA